MNIPMVSYNDILNSAKKYYEYSVDGKQEEAAKYLDKYFLQSRIVSPTAALMSLQEAKKDVFARQYEIPLINGSVDTEELLRRVSCYIDTCNQLSNDTRLIDLGINLEKSNPHTARKRAKVLEKLSGLENKEVTQAIEANKGKFKYDDVVESAKSFYDNVAIGKTGEASLHLDKYFMQSRTMNPSVARMALQQAQNDAFYETKMLKAKGYIDVNKANLYISNILRAMFGLNRDKRLWSLEKHIGNLYKDTARKRLSIIPCLADGKELGLVNVNATINGKNIKLGKKIQYTVRKLLKR